MNIVNVANLVFGKVSTITSLNCTLYEIHKESLKALGYGISQEPYAGCYTPMFKYCQEITISGIASKKTCEVLLLSEKNVISSILKKGEFENNANARNCKYFLECEKGKTIMIKKEKPIKMKENNIMKLFLEGLIQIRVSSEKEVEVFLKDLSLETEKDYEGLLCKWQLIDVKVKGQIYYKFNNGLSYLYQPIDESVVVNYLL